MPPDPETLAVLDLGARWASAERAGDTAALAELLADDFVAVGPVGFVLTRTQWLDRYRDGLRHDAFDWSEPAVHRHGDAAVVIATQTQRTSYQGHDASGRFRIMQVAVRDGARWRLAAIHLSPIVERPHGARP